MHGLFSNFRDYGQKHEYDFKPNSVAFHTSLRRPNLQIADLAMDGNQLGAHASTLEIGGQFREHLVEMKGPLTTGATLAENFQLEYLEGLPEAEVGWGRVNEDTMRSLMAIHAASSEIVQRTRYIAQVQASNLLTHILQTMEQAQLQKPVAGAIGGFDDKLVFLVGHDTNIANVAGSLDAHWLINGYQRDDAAPGEALVFELWQKAGHEDTVQIYYTAQTPPTDAQGYRPDISRAPAESGRIPGRMQWSRCTL